MSEEEVPVVDVEVEAPVTPPEEVEAPKEAEEAVVPKDTERPVWTMPVQKAQEEKHRAVEKARQEAEEAKDVEIASIREEYEERLRVSAPKSSYDTELEQVAEEYGLDPKAAGALLNVLKKSLPDTSRFDVMLKEKEIESHKMQVSKEFDELVAPLILKDNPHATPEFLRESKLRIEELAFSKGYNTYQLADIYKVKRDEFEFKNGFSAESSGGRSSELVDFERMTDTEEHNLAMSNPAKFKEFSYHINPI